MNETSCAFPGTERTRAPFGPETGSPTASQIPVVYWVPGPLLVQPPGQPGAGLRSNIPFIAVMSTLSRSVITPLAGPPRGRYDYPA